MVQFASASTATHDSLMAILSAVVLVAVCLVWLGRQGGTRRILA